MTITKTFEINIESIIDNIYQRILNAIWDEVVDDIGINVYEVLNDTEKEKIFNEVCDKIAEELKRKD